MAGRKRVSQADWQESADSVAKAPSGPKVVTPDEMDRLRAQGYTKPMLENIHLELSQSDFYELLKFIEGRAVGNSNYFEIRQAVLFSEMFRGQAREQGH
jgi:hypothetical protein